MNGYISTEEIWVGVVGHPRYEVSNFGNVRRYPSKQPVAQNLNAPNGYYRVYMDGKKYYVHRIMAESFIDEDCTDLDVNHIDGNKRNNFLGNLEWRTRRDNIREAYKTGLKNRKVVCCKYCIYRDTNDFCTDREDDFYCADGIVKKNTADGYLC